MDDDLGNYVDLVLHDLTSPLSSLGMWISVLRSADDPALREKATDAIDRSAQMQSRLVEDLRDLSRALRTDLHLAREVVALSALVEIAIDRNRLIASERDYAIDARIAPGLEILGDDDRLVRTFERLVELVVCVGAPGGRIAIDLVADGDAIACTLSRTPVDHQSKVSLGFLFARAMLQLHGATLLVREDGFVVRFERA